jgi:hypothetical protein
VVKTKGRGPSGVGARLGTMYIAPLLASSTHPRIPPPLSTHGPAPVDLFSRKEGAADVYLRVAANGHDKASYTFAFGAPGADLLAANVRPRLRLRRRPFSKSVLSPDARASVVRALVDFFAPALLPGYPPLPALPALQMLAAPAEEASHAVEALGDDAEGSTAPDADLDADASYEEGDESEDNETVGNEDDEDSAPGIALRLACVQIVLARVEARLGPLEDVCRDALGLLGASFLAHPHALPR